ncbi:MAG: hypothetical protein WAM42_00065 [Candidatus Nitrosopolaris sp.]
MSKIRLILNETQYYLATLTLFLIDLIDGKVTEEEKKANAKISFKNNETA